MANKAVALALSTHPGPTVAVTAITVLLGIGVELGVARTTILGLAFLLGQASVGLSNDWIDAERDRAVGRTDKPIASGLVSVGAARLAAWASAAAAVALTVPLGWPATVAHAVFIASAWAYNAGLKNTLFSVLPYIVSFGLLPSIVTLSLPTPIGPPWWATVAGAALGTAAHFANVLPDLEDDRATGIAGLPHRLGRRAAGIATYGVLAAASALVVIAPGHPTVLGWIGLAATLAIAAWGIWLVLFRRPTRLLFQLIIAGALIDVLLLVASSGRLLQ